MTVKRLESLLKSSEDRDLGKIAQQARDFGRLTEALRSQLPATDADGVLAASIHANGELVVLAASPAWAARLRFLSDSLIAAARRSGADVETCRVRVSRG